MGIEVPPVCDEVEVEVVEVDVGCPAGVEYPKVATGSMYELFTCAVHCR
jgi:hypothetical protein